MELVARVLQISSAQVPAVVAQRSGVAAMISYYNGAPIGVVIACLGVFSVLSFLGGPRLRREIPRHGKTPRRADS